MPYSSPMVNAGHPPTARKSMPFHAIVLVALAWMFCMVLIAMYATIALALFPVAPFIVMGIACLLRSVHDYANTARESARG